MTSSPYTHAVGSYPPTRQRASKAPGLPSIRRAPGGLKFCAQTPKYPHHPFRVAPLIHAPDFLRHGALLIALLGVGLSWVAGQLLDARRPLRGAARRGFYLGLGAVNGMALVAMVGMAVAIL